MKQPFLLWHAITWLLLAAGLVGAALPLAWLPGLPILWLGVWLYGWATGYSEYGFWFIALQGVLVLVGTGLDYVAGAIGTKRYGGSRAGAWGAFLGGLAGIALMPIGLILGPFVGALVAEALSGRPPREALRSAWGSVLGMLGGIALKVLIAVVMIVLFVWRAY